MDSEVPPAHSLVGKGSSWPRDWLGFDQYREVHERYLEVLIRDGFVSSHSLEFIVIRGSDRRPVQILLEGAIECDSGVRVVVRKYMETRSVPPSFEVRSTYYNYHAYRPATDSQIIRYDCDHGGLHYHRFSRDGMQGEYVELDLDSMPRLDAVVREAVDLARAWSAG